MDVEGDRDILKIFGRLRASFHSGLTKRLLPKMAELVQKTTVRRFETKLDPFGQPWKAWSDEYAATRGPGHSLLIDEGSLLEDLSSGFAAERDGDDIVYGSSLPYASHVQNRRQFLGFDPNGEEVSGLEAMLEDFALKEASRRGFA